MKVTRTSRFTGQIHTMEIPLTEKELQEGLDQSWSANPGKGTRHMQDIFPQLNADQLEFLMTGCTPDEWDAMFPSNNGDDE